VKEAVLARGVSSYIAQVLREKWMSNTYWERHELTDGTSATTSVAGLDALPDEELLRRYRDSRRAEVFGEMVRRHQPMVWRTCLRLAGNVHDAEDAAQSVFLALAQRPQVVRRSLAGCLHALARAAVSELHRSRRRRHQREELAVRINSLFDRLRGGYQPMAHYELREELDVALAQMPDPLRQAVILRYLEGHSQEEAARQVGCTQVTLGWRAMKGLERLRTILGRRGVALAPAALLAVLAAEAQAATALGLAGTARAATTATAAQLARTLVRWSVLGSVARKTALIALLATASVGVGASVVFLPNANKEVPSQQAPPNAPAPGQHAPAGALALGVFDRSLDIGGPARAGAALFSEKTYTLQGGGANIYSKADQFRFVCRPCSGDGEIVACVTSNPEQDARQVVAGVMFRDGLAADSHHVSLLMDASGGAHVVCRSQEHPASICDNFPPTNPGKHWVRLVRRGNTFSAFVHGEGTETWKLVKAVEVPLNSSLYLGLAVTAHDDAQLATTTIDHVAIGRGS
jgi:RNA polymerase sigma factor (sigma-70 family)